MDNDRNILTLRGIKPADDLRKQGSVEILKNTHMIKETTSGIPTWNNTHDTKVQPEVLDALNKLLLKQMDLEGTTVTKTDEKPKWENEVDMFTNFVTQEKMEFDDLVKVVKEIIEEIKKDKENSYYSSPDALTYTQQKNNFFSNITLDKRRKCGFTIGVYTYEEGKCLIDIQELNGEHFTFDQFLNLFVSALQKHKIITAHTFSEEFLNSYGLDIEISLDGYFAETQKI